MRFGVAVLASIFLFAGGHLFVAGTRLAATRVRAAVQSVPVGHPSGLSAEACH